MLGDGDWVPCPAFGRRYPLADGEADVPWPCDAENKYIVHFPDDARDLVIRIRLRRQRTARQEVLRAAYRLGDGARRRLARRAHADPQADQPRGRVEVHRRRVPVARAARPTSPCSSRPIPSMAGRPRRSATTSAWMKFGDDGRLLRDQPRGRLLRRRAGHVLRDECQRDGDAAGATRSTRTPRSPTTATSGGKA